MADATAEVVPPSNLMASDLSMRPLNHAFTNDASMLSRWALLSGPMTYGERLADAMERARLTGPDARARLAKHLGISVQAIGQVLQGKSKAFSAEVSARAARFLKVDHFWLATGEGEPQPLGPSEEALAFAARYDKLNLREREKFSAALILAREGVPDQEVEERMPITKKRATAKH